MFYISGECPPTGLKVIGAEDEEKAAPLSPPHPPPLAVKFVTSFRLTDTVYFAE